MNLDDRAIENAGAKRGEREAERQGDGVCEMSDRDRVLAHDFRADWSITRHLSASICIRLHQLTAAHTQIQHVRTPAPGKSLRCQLQPRS